MRFNKELLSFRMVSISEYKSGSSEAEIVIVDGSMESDKPYR